MEEATRKFNVIDNKTEMKEILSSVYNSLVVKGYNPINQIVGYILSEDPTYITNYNNARSLSAVLTETSCFTSWLSAISRSRQGLLSIKIICASKRGADLCFFVNELLDNAE